MHTQGKEPTTPSEEQVKQGRNKLTLSWKAHQNKQAFNKYTGDWVGLEEYQAHKEQEGSISSGRPDSGREVKEDVYVKMPHGRPKVHVFKDAKGNFSIRTLPPAETQLQFNPFPFTFMSGLNLGKLGHDESDPSFANTQPANNLSVATLLALAGVGFVFGPLVVPMMPFLPFLVKINYSQYLDSKAVEFAAYRQILGTDTIILNWNGTVDVKMLDKLFDIAASQGMRIEIPEDSALRTQLKGSHDHEGDLGFLYFKKRIDELNENANIFALQRNADNTKSPKESAVSLNKQEKLEKQFPGSELSDKERQDKYEQSLIKDEAGAVKKEMPLVDSLSTALADLDKRVAGWEEENEKQRALISSFDKLLKNPEKMAKALPKKPSLGSMIADKTVKKIRDKQKELLKDTTKGIALLQNRVSEMEDPMNQYIRASDAEVADIVKRLEVIKKQLVAAKQAANDDPELKAAQEKVTEAKDRLTILQKGGSDQQKDEQRQKINNLQNQLAQLPDKNSDEAKELQAKLTEAKGELDILQKGGSEKQIKEKEEQITRLENNVKGHSQGPIAAKVDEQLKKIEAMEKKFADDKTEKDVIKARFGHGPGSYAEQLNQLAVSKGMEPVAPSPKGPGGR